MKYLLLAIFTLAAFADISNSQTGLTAVMVNTNQQIAKPTNFIQANNIATNEFCQFFQTQFVAYANLTTDTIGAGNEFISNSIATVNISATNTATNGKSAVRLINAVNNRGPAGGGTSWLKANHTFWTRIDAALWTNGFVRSVIGNNSTILTNVANYPTNQAVGYELGRTDTNVFGTLRIRLIAHNGTNATNGPWVNTGGNIFQIHTIGVSQKTNGEVKLYVSVEDFTKPQELTNAAITGGPSGNGTVSCGAWDLGLFQNGTNTFNSGTSIYTAWASWTN